MVLWAVPNSTTIPTGTEGDVFTDGMPFLLPNQQYRSITPEVVAVQIVAGFLSDNLLSGVHLHLYIPHIANLVGTVMAMIYYHSVEMWNSPRFLLLFMPYWFASTVIEGMKTSNLNIRGLSHIYMRPHLTRSSIVVYCLLCLIELDVLRQLVS